MLYQKNAILLFMQRDFAWHALDVKEESEKMKSSNPFIENDYEKTPHTRRPDRGLLSAFCCSITRMFS